MRSLGGRTSLQGRAMTFRLRDNLHWCACGGRVIFLDVEADRYFCLPSGAGAAFTRLAAGETEPQDTERLHALITRGLLIEHPASPGLRPAPALEPATGDLLEEPYPSPNTLEVVSAFAAEMRAAWLLRRRPFLEVLRGVDEERAGRRRQPSDFDRCLRGIVSASMAASLVLRATDRCLVRALAVHSTCRRHGIYPKLVFGVRMNPFGAHCWVQLDDKVLVGDFEQVRLFEPIAAFG